jgi:hypothetical protein
MNKYRTGKRPARHGAIRHKFKTFFDASALPTPPTVFGRTSYFPEDGWGMLYNDQAGCCVISGGMHETMLWGALGGHGAPPFTDAQIISDYSAITGYDPKQTDANGDNPTDQGTDMVVAAQYRQTKGLLDAKGIRHKVDGFVSIETGNVEEVALAAYLFGGIGVGALLPADAEDQFDANHPWTVTSKRGEDGHYFPIVGRNHEGNLLAVTWGRLQAVTPQWLAKWMDEGVAYISFESLRQNTMLSQRGMDMAGLRAAFGKFGLIRPSIT